MNLDSPITNIPKLPKPQQAALKKLGLTTVQDLLLFFPYRYVDFSKVSTIRDLQAGQAASVKVTIKNISSRFSFRSHLALAEAVVSDETGSMKVVWFNQAYLAKALKNGDEVYLSGTPEYYNFGLQLTNPLYEKISDFPVHTARLVPVYHLTSGLYPKTLRNAIASVLNLADEAEDVIPHAVRENQQLPNISETIRLSHFPEKLDHVYHAQKRLAFEEIFINQLLAQKHKIQLAQKQSFAVPFDQKFISTFVGNLPFKLTPEQKKAAWDVLQDLEKQIPMNRLIEGDVGSGKTVVALLAALEVATNDLQVAFLAPTEILARQHYVTIQNLLKNKRTQFDGRQIVSCLLTNNFAETSRGKDVTKSKLQKLIVEGMPGIYIGTHALLSNKVKFKNLALVIIDEQHRFGVEQRATLMRDSIKVPHLLSLTATPIPRTLQLAYYGELEISQIKSKPADRKPIATRLVQKNDRTKAYHFMEEQISLGRQAFVITPLIEETENSESKAAKVEFEALKKVFPKLTIGLLHGRLKGKDKEQVMQDFLANKIHILVSTSVVEVGVDVPNASVMLIEGADRFGLAQLHQFRGRVGRAEHQSYCLLFTENENPEVTDRLTQFTKTEDGFALAELDLKQRGFGELYGQNQSGWNFKYFNPSYVSLIEPARNEAQKLLEKDQELKKYPLLKQEIEGKTIHFE